MYTTAQLQKNELTMQMNKNKDEIVQKTERNDVLARLSFDALAAFTAAMSVSPTMVIIDRAVTEAAAGSASISQSMRACTKHLILRPHRFLSSFSFGTMFVLYAGTYLTANTMDTISSIQEDLPAGTTTSSTSKLLAVTGVNLGLALFKDASYARRFGTGVTTSMPAIAFSPLVVRDGITLFATFNLPTKFAPELPQSWEKHISRLSVAQMLCPAASQFVATPLHVLGLDLYYRGRDVGWHERFAVIRRTYLGTSFARACRMIPAYGVGGVVNNETRRALMKRLEDGK